MCFDSIWSKLIELYTKQNTFYYMYTSILNIYKVYVHKYIYMCVVCIHTYVCACVYIIFLSLKGLGTPDLQEKHFFMQTDILPFGAHVVEVGRLSLNPKYMRID